MDQYLKALNDVEAELSDIIAKMGDDKSAAKACIGIGVSVAAIKVLDLIEARQRNSSQ